MATEYEVGQRIKLDDTAVSLEPGTPAATLQYQWAFIAGDPDGITMSEVDAANNIVTGETAPAYKPSAEGAARGAVKAENAGGSDIVWYPQVNFRSFPDVYTDDFTSYASNAELQAEWEKVSGEGGLLFLDSGNAATFNTDLEQTLYRWNAPSNRPNNANFKLYMEARTWRSVADAPRDFWIYYRGNSDSSGRLFIDENRWPQTEFYSVLLDLKDGLLRYKWWLRGDPEPADWTGDDPATVQEGDIGVITKAGGTLRLDFASIAFNGEDPDRPV